MDQIIVNPPTKTPVNSTNTETLVNSNNTETLVNSISPDPFKDPGPHQSHTWKNTILDVYLTTKLLENF